MCFGGDDERTTTTESEVTLSPEQRRLVRAGTPGIEGVVNRVNQGNLTFPDISGFNPLELAGQASAIGAIPGLTDQINSLSQGSSFLTSGDVLSPESNPALGATIDAAVRPIIENATENLLPNIRRGAVGSGNFGGSRSDVLQQNAVRDVERNVGDVSAQIATEGYGQGLEAFTRGLALAPQNLTASLFPSQVLSSVGAQQRGQEQSVAQREFEQQIAPLIFGQQAIGAAGATPGGGTTTTSSTPVPGTSPMNLLGAGLALGTTPMFGGPAAGTLFGAATQGLFGAS